MILLNDDYVELGLDSAVRQNSMILDRDKSKWFYKKWHGLTESRGREEKLENRAHRTG